MNAIRRRPGLVEDLHGLYRYFTVIGTDQGQLAPLHPAVHQHHGNAAILDPGNVLITQGGRHQQDAVDPAPVEDGHSAEEILGAGLRIGGDDQLIAGFLQAGFGAVEHIKEKTVGRVVLLSGGNDDRYGTGPVGLHHLGGKVGPVIDLSGRLIDQLHAAL